MDSELHFGVNFSAYVAAMQYFFRNNSIFTYDARKTSDPVNPYYALGFFTLCCKSPNKMVLLCCVFPDFHSTLSLELINVYTIF